jgi:hypothetical protein
MEPYGLDPAGTGSMFRVSLQPLCHPCLSLKKASGYFDCYQSNVVALVNSCAGSAAAATYTSAYALLSPECECSAEIENWRYNKLFSIIEDTKSDMT